MRAELSDVVDGEEDDHFGDMQPIVAGERDWRYHAETLDTDLAAFVRDADQFRSMSVVRDPDDPDLAAEAARWQLQLRDAAADVKPCSSMQRAVDKWADGSRHGQFSGALAVIRLDERGHRGLATAVDQLWQVRAKDERDFNKVLRDARKIVLTDPTPKDEHGCDCDAWEVAILPRIGEGGVEGHERHAGGLETAGLGSHVPTSWLPIDLGPYLRGEITPAVPSVGVARADGVQFLYPGKEHACIGETESGKSWFALACVAAVLLAGGRVVYIHFEEADPADTLARLQLLGVPVSRIIAGVAFVGPETPVTPHSIARLIEVPPQLVVLDGVNEAMALHAQKINDPDGAAAYRTRLVKPFKAAGAAVLSLDHVVKDPDRNGQGYAFGSIHKTNGLDGAMFLIENREPFGKGRRGNSGVYVTKDRPGNLRTHGVPTKVARKFHLGEMVVDSTSGFEFALFPPKTEDRKAEDGTAEQAELDEEVYKVVLQIIERGKPATGSAVRAAVRRRPTDVLAALERLYLGDRLLRVEKGQTKTYSLPSVPKIDSEEVSP